MADDGVLLAEGKLTAYGIDFDHPEFCEFMIEGYAERFMASRSLTRGVNRCSVVLVAYLPGERYAEVLGMIVLRCGRSSSETDRDSLRGAVVGCGLARRILRASAEWAEVEYLRTRSIGVADPAVVVDARHEIPGMRSRPLPGLPGEAAIIFAPPREVVAADLARYSPEAAARLVRVLDPDRPMSIVVLTRDGDVAIFTRPSP